MRLESMLAACGLALGLLCASASPAAAEEPEASSRGERAGLLAAVPSEVPVRPPSLLCGGCGCPTPCEEEGDPCCSPCPAWSVTVGGWIWGVKGTLGDNGRRVDVDSSWTDTLDLLDKIEAVADLRVRMKTGRWSFTLELDGARLADASTFREGSVFVNGEFSLWVLQGQVGYGIAGGRLGCGPCAPVGCLEAYAGARAWWVDVDVDAGIVGALPRPGIHSSKSWIDPIVGLRGDLRFGGKWFAMLEADVGGFGLGSEFSWHAMGAVGYQFNRHVAAELGWKHLDVDYRSGAFVFDVALSGPFLAFTFSF